MTFGSQAVSALGQLQSPSSREALAASKPILVRGSGRSKAHPRERLWQLSGKNYSIVGCGEPVYHRDTWRVLCHGGGEKTEGTETIGMAFST